MSKTTDITVVTQNNRYDSLNGLRAIAAVCIAAMHVYSNFGEMTDVFVLSEFIESWRMLTVFFLMLSGFSMCCGYYEKIMSGNISVVNFYKKRYAKILPFFSLITLLDVIAAPSVESFYEGFANITLAFGLLPNANISVIGVGWTLGIIFLFYMLFPFYCFLLHNKRAAWFSLVLSLIYHYLCCVYFLDENHVLKGVSSTQNIVYYSMFFIAGGLIYLYREKLADWATRYHLGVLSICIILSGIFYTNVGITSSNFYLLLLFSAWLIYGLNSKNIVLNNPATKFVSGVSMEIYLAHMLVFRIIEKLNLKYLFGKGFASYVVTFCLTIVITILFAVIVKWVFDKIAALIHKKRTA